MGVMEARRRILLNQPHLIDASGNPIAFQTDMAAKMGVKAYFSPVQSGSGDPSPSNVRPIRGWTGCNVTRCGKNLFNPANLVSGKYFNRNGTMSENVSFSYAYVRVNAGEKIIFSGLKGANGNPIGVQFFDINKEFVSDLDGSAQNNNTVYTVPNGAYYVGVSAFSGSNQTYNDVNSLQLELGSTATAYTPYSGATYPVDWTSEAGTVYGGYVDYERGEVVAEWVSAQLNGLATPAAWSDQDQSKDTLGGYCNANLWAETGLPYPLGNSLTETSALFDWCKRERVYGVNTPYIANFLVLSGSFTRFEIRLPKSVLSEPTRQGVIDYMNAHPLQACYMIATPIHYPLTPTLIKSLKGANTIWSDMNGNLEIGYWKH